MCPKINIFTLIVSLLLFLIINYHYASGKNVFFFFFTKIILLRRRDRDLPVRTEILYFSSHIYKYFKSHIAFTFQNVYDAILVRLRKYSSRCLLSDYYCENAFTRIVKH